MNGKNNWIASAGFVVAISLGAVGCSGTGSDAGLSPAVIDAAAGTGSVSAIGSSIEAVMETSVSQSTAAALALGPDSESGNFTNCEESEGAEGTTVMCDCIGGGSVTHTFDKTIDHDGECTRANENNSNPGKVNSFEGSATVTFEDCVIDQCGQEVTLNGSVSEEVSFLVNTCDQEESFFTIDVQTSGACDGLEATVGEDTTVIGLNASISRTHGPQEVSGDLCVDGESTPFESISELNKALDPEGECEDQEAEDTETQEETASELST